METLFEQSESDWLSAVAPYELTKQFADVQPH